MNSQTYLALPHVSGFIRWLASELNSESCFKHQYVNRRSGEKWTCSSLYNAFENYRWNHPGNARLGFNPGVCSSSNGIALSALRQDLVSATGSDSHTLEAAVDVMRWGGVMARNADWLKANNVGLGRMLQGVQAAIVAGDDQAPVLRSKSLRFNSGMTKVYSLLCKDFIIYDSRVAAGLGWLVVKHCQAHGLSKVPAALCFPWAAAKEGENTLAPKRRDPGTGGLKFKGLRSGHHHAMWNMRASWVLSAVLAHPDAAGSRFHVVPSPNDPLRALEAALFMIGYDLGDQRPAFAA
ncbi:hypothetical protein TU85_03060 [Pseudomonas helleri]|uniref:hypothetical protein n=1 Tax=Pseudomonas helleri TaxID=1608996 RepID=UPI000653AD6D|nr:hypothetical protein [Pseudomonas helleri]KMN24597.1 hypothetical protein TU85_03060 [Pseudomonas helleri]